MTRLPREQRRAQIVRAAATAFVRSGFDGTSVEDVAREAGVTRLIVYRIFESKDDLYRAVLETVTGRLADVFGESPPAVADRSVPVASTLLDIARDDPDGFRLLWRHAGHEPAFAELAELFRAGTTEYAIALLRPYIDDLVVLRWGAAAIVAYLYDGICSWLDSGPTERDDEFADLLTRGMRGLVGAWSETSPHPA